MSNKTSDIFSHILDQVRDTVTFVPNNDQKRARSNFWITVGELGLDVGANSGVATALQHSGDRRVAEWWNLPGFSDWFLNREEFRQRVDFLASLALDELEVVLRTPGHKDKIVVAKMLLEERNKRLAASEGATGADLGDKLSKMSRAELDAFIKARVAKLSPVPDTEK
jgi:hypothetical protein